MFDRLTAKRTDAENRYKALTENKISFQNIPATLLRIDGDYDAIFSLLASWTYPHSTEQRDDFYCRAKRAFFSYFDKNYEKPIADMQALTNIDNAFPGGIFNHFRSYLHDRNNYVQRAKELLLYLDEKLNGQGSHKDALHFPKTPQRSNSDVIFALRKAVAIKNSASATDILTAFAAVQQILSSAKTEEMSKHAAALITNLKYSMETFGFKGYTTSQIKLANSQITARSVHASK